MISALRLVGLAFGLVFLVGLFRVRRGQRLRNIDWLAGSAIAALFIVLSAWPDSANTVLGWFAFQRGGGGRLLGLVTFSTLALYLLVFAALARSNRLERTIDQLVRELAKREFRRDQAASDVPIWVVIPAFNEADNVAAVLDEIPPQICGRQTRALVVVDGATDRTESIVKDLQQAAVSYAINRGGGSALRAGYDLALENGAEVVVTLDADGQHLPDEIPALVQPILDDRADLVIGSRVLGRYESDSRVRASGVVFFNWLCTILTMRRITDCSNGFRAIRADGLRRLHLRQVQFHASEMLLEALKKGLRVIEVPVTVQRRRSGASKKGPTLRYALGFTRVILGTWLR